MAPPAGTLRVGRYFLALGILLAVLYGITFFPGSRNTPSLGLDLVGGAQVVLQASTNDGSAPTRDSMNEARTIIEDRVNGRGVSNSQVAIEGSDRITVTIPGRRADDIDDIGNTALLNFRPLVAGPFPSVPVAATPTTSGSAVPTDGTTAVPTDGTSATAAPTSAAATGAPTTAQASDNASPQDDAARPLAAATTPAPTASPVATDSPAPTAAATDPTAAATDPTAAATDPAATPTAAASGTGAATSGDIAPVPGADAVTQDQITAYTSDQTNAAVAGATTLSEAQIRGLIAFQCGKTDPSKATDQNIVACNQDGSAKYVLAPQIFPGTEISSAAAIAPNAQTAAQGWTVSLDLKSNGAKLWADYTGKNNCGGVSCTATSPPASYVAFTLDGEVITAPGITSAITGQTQISGSFTEDSATNLANSLKYGALPLSFEELTSQTVSATLGTSQLQAGLLAGGIGLALVVIYSLLYYRGLGLVTLASLAVSGAIVYASLVILGNNIGFTLTLAGVAGFIVAVGITADSFVVFFERIKDEVHDGRSMRVAVPRAWTRARRTVISADVVSLLAALVLYFLAAGEVRGFAFTLGLSTIIDVIVVFWFTHPLVSLLSRFKAFGSKRFTGLDSVRTGPAPTKPAPGRRPARPVKATAAASAGTVVIEKRSSVAVLERDDDVTDELVDDAPTTPVEATPTVEPTEDVADSAVPDDDVVTTADPAADDADGSDDTDDDAPAPKARRRTSSNAASGSAAERAAARRAKLRSDQTPNSQENGA